MLQEAFAREIIVMVNKVHRTMQASTAESLYVLADPDDPRAQLDLLDPEIITALTDPEVGYAVQVSMKRFERTMAHMACESNGK